MVNSLCDNACASRKLLLGVALLVFFYGLSRQAPDRENFVECSELLAEHSGKRVPTAIARVTAGTAESTAGIAGAGASGATECLDGPGE